MNQVLGIDIGGSGIKAAVVDVDRGVLVGRRRRSPTPIPAIPQAVTAAAAALAPTWQGPVGVGFPGVIKGGRVMTAANLDTGWIGLTASTTGTRWPGSTPPTLINDADAAGMAEVRFGAGARADGTIVMVTLGTGIGSALFVDGVLVPNTELGHLVIGGVEAETLASARAKEQQEMSWKRWSGHLKGFLDELERLLWPDLFIIGGGISAEFRAFCKETRTRTPAVPAEFGNDAGIVGAAIAGHLDTGQHGRRTTDPGRPPITFDSD